MKVNNILKDRNFESPDSTLKVKYIVNYGIDKTYKKIQLNPSFFKINTYTPKKRYIVNDLRKEQFNSYSNENMDFFRLDHLSECDRDNYHNKFMDNIKPVNRSANFSHFNDISKNIKYLDYLKENYLLNQNKKINSNILSEKDLEIAKKRENYYNNKSNISQNNPNENNQNNRYEIDSYMNLNKIDRYKNLYKKELLKNNSAPLLTGKYLDNNIILDEDNDISKNMYNNHENNNGNNSYSNLYLPNINNYSIKEGDANFYKDSTKLKLYPTYQREPYYNEKMKRLYNQENYKSLLNNNPFYKAYNENSKNGFLKRNGDFLNCEKLNRNKFFFRNDRSDINRRGKRICNFNLYNQMKNIPLHFNNQIYQ